MARNFPGGQGVENPLTNVGGTDSTPGKTPWNRKWQPTPVFLPEEPHGLRILAGYSPWGCKELDMTEHTHTHHILATVNSAVVKVE